MSLANFHPAVNMNRSTVDRLFTVTNLLHSSFRNSPGDAYKKRPKPGKPRFKKKTKPVLILGLGKVGQRRVLILGKVLLYTAFVSYLTSFLSHEWVCRVTDTSEDSYDAVMVKRPRSHMPSADLYCYGLWKACDKSGYCNRVWKRLRLHPVSVVGVLVMATNALLGYGMAVILDVASRFSLLLFLAINRVIEYCAAVSAVLQFMALLHFTGQVKNQAPLVHGARYEAGWGFVLACVSMFLGVVSVMVMALFRVAPGRQNHRQFWKLPADMRPRSYLSRLNSTPGEAGGRGGETELERCRTSSRSERGTGPSVLRAAAAETLLDKGCS